MTRTQGLSAAGVVSKQELDQAKSTLDAAQAQMESLDSQVSEQQVQLHYYKVVARVAGLWGIFRCMWGTASRPRRY